MGPELDTLRQNDGKFYVLPGLHEEVWPDYTLIVRTDIFEENNIAIPTTWDELYTAMKKLKKSIQILFHSLIVLHLTVH